MTPPLALTLISMAKVEPNLGSRVKFGGFLQAAPLVAFPNVRYVYEMSAYSDAFETNSRHTEYERPATSGLRFNTDLYGGFGPMMR